MMYAYVSFARAVGGAVVVAGVLAGCSAAKRQPVAPVEQAPPASTEVVCTAAPDSPLVGTWYSVSRPQGFAGELQTLTVLAADGSMAYETQMKVGKRIRPALRETGCWSVADGVYALQTTRSNGVPVDTEDPIYQTRYQLVKAEAARLTLREMKPKGQQIVARRMKPGYRLPQ